MKIVIELNKAVGGYWDGVVERLRQEVSDMLPL